MQKKLFFMFVLLAHAIIMSAADHKRELVTGFANERELKIESQEFYKNRVCNAQLVQVCPELPGEVVENILSQADDLSLTVASGVSRQWHEESRRCLKNRVNNLLKEFNGNYNTALRYAVKFNLPSTMMTLIHRGAYVGHCYKDGKTPLIVASCCGSADVVKVLMHNFYQWAYASDHLDEKMEKSALEYAIENHHGDVVTLLLSNGMRCWGSCSPLHYAVEKGDLSVITSIVETGLSALDRAYYPHWKTALQVAQEKGSEDIVDYLLSCGADSNYNPQVDKEFREQCNICQGVMLMALGPLAVGVGLLISISYYGQYAENIVYCVITQGQ